MLTKDNFKTCGGFIVHFFSGTLSRETVLLVNIWQTHALLLQNNTLVIEIICFDGISLLFFAIFLHYIWLLCSFLYIVKSWKFFANIQITCWLWIYAMHEKQTPNRLSFLQNWRNISFNFKIYCAILLRQYLTNVWSCQLRLARKQYFVCENVSYWRLCDAFSANLFIFLLFINVLNRCQ